MEDVTATFSLVVWSCNHNIVNAHGKTAIYYFFDYRDPAAVYKMLIFPILVVCIYKDNISVMPQYLCEVEVSTLIVFFGYITS